MAGEEFKDAGARGMTGDKPIDQLALALGCVTRTYEDRFSRKPTLAEVTYALSLVLRTNPEKYLSDPESLTAKGGRIFMSIDISQYEGAYSDETDPGFHLIERRTPGGPRPYASAIKVPTLETRNRTLVCEFETLEAGLSDPMVEVLVSHCVLKEFCMGKFRRKVDRVEFRNLRTNRLWAIDYPD